MVSIERSIQPARDKIAIAIDEGTTAAQLKNVQEIETRTREALDLQLQALESIRDNLDTTRRSPY